MSRLTSLIEAVDAIRSTAERMRTDRRFKVVFEEYPKLDEADLTEWQNWLAKQPRMTGYTIPATVRDVYRATGGFRWQWQYLPGSPPRVTTGSAEIVTAFALYQRDDEADRAISDLLGGIRKFDIVSDAEFVGAHFSREDSESVGLEHLDEEEKKRASLTLDPPAYLQMLAKYRARYGWQRFFVRGRVAPEKDIRTMEQEFASLFGSDQ